MGSLFSLPKKAGDTCKSVNVTAKEGSEACKALTVVLKEIDGVQVNASVQQVGELSEVLREVVGGIDVEQVNASVQQVGELSEVLREVVGCIDGKQVNASVQQVGKSFESMAASAHTIAEVVGDLRGFAAMAMCACTLNQLSQAAINMGITEAKPIVAKIPQLDTTNDILAESRDDNRESQLRETAMEIFPLDKRDEWINQGKIYIFFCSNNMVTLNLQSNGYWAYDDPRELFKTAGLLNAIQIAEEEREDVAIRGWTAESREMIIIFLDTSPGMEITELTFPSCFRIVKLVVPSRQSGALKLGKVVVEAGCTLRLEHATIGGMEAHGRALLKKCTITCSSKLPCLFARNHEAVDQQYPIHGNVEFRDCSFDNNSQVGVEFSYNQGRFHPGGASLYFGITNITEQPWTASFSTRLGNAYYIGQKAEGVVIPANASVKIKHTTTQGFMHGNMVFTDHLGGMMELPYRCLPIGITITLPVVALTEYKLGID